MCFCCLYKLYLTKLGKSYHKKQIQKCHKKGIYQKRQHDCGVFKYGDVKVHVIPFLEDNYSYIIEKPQEDQYTSAPVALVDPADFEAVQSRLLELNLKPTMILCTHKHWDHAAGNLDFLHKYYDIKIYGSATDKPEGLTQSVTDGSMIPFGEELKFKSVYTGGHTRGHMMYKLDIQGQELVFSGDFLFQGFCGIPFESNAAIMSGILRDVKQNQIDPEALIFPGHNYGEKNLEFTLKVQPDNAAAKIALEKIKAQRIQREETKNVERFSYNLCPVPLRMQGQLEYNLALRIQEQDLRQILGKQTDELNFKELLERKESFNSAWEKAHKK